MLDSLKKFTFVRLIDRLIEKGTFSPHFHIQSNTELIEVRQRSTTWNQKLASHPTIQIKKVRQSLVSNTGYNTQKSEAKVDFSFVEGPEKCV